MTKTFTFRSILAALFLTCCFQSSFAQTFWTETFSSQASSTTNWVHSGTNSGPRKWQWTNNVAAGNWQPGNFAAASAATGYMYFDSDSNGNFAHDARLTNVNIPVNASGKNNVHLKFFTYFRTYSGADVARVGVSTDGTNFTYHNVPQFDALQAETTTAQVYQGFIDLEIPEANNQAQVWVQFRWEGQFEYYWKVDDIEMYEGTGAVPCDQNPLSIICDNLDTYNAAQKLGPQATHWTTWSGAEGGAEDGIVSTEQANTAPNSLKIISTNATGGPQDVILDLGDKATGRYELKLSMYVPAGKNGYYNVQQSYPIGNGGQGDWNLNMFFENTNKGRLTDGANVLLSEFTFPYDKWFTIRHVFDLDNNLLSTYVDGKFVKKTAYARNLGGIDFFGTNAVSTFYVDDIEYIGLPPIVFNVDNCDGAIDITSYFGGVPGTPQTTGLYNNTTATVDPSDPGAPSCFLDGLPDPAVATLNGTMWYTFTGDGETYHVETVPCNATDYIDDGDTQMALYTGDCGSLIQIDCNEDLTGADDFRSALDIETQSGVDYRLLVDGWSNAAGVVSGEFCLQITRKADIFCGDAVVGSYTLDNNGFVCFGGNVANIINLNSDEFVLPNQGPIYGMGWAVTFAPVPSGVWPPSLGNQYIGGTRFITNPILISFPNNDPALTDPVVLFFTPVVISGASSLAADPFMEDVDTTGACFFTGVSSPVVYLPELQPLSAEIDASPASPGNNDGSIDLTITGGIYDFLQDPALSYSVEWTGPNGYTSNEEDISGLAAGDYTAVITDLSGCADPYDFVVSVTTAVKDPASVKSLTLSPNPTANVTMLKLELANAADVRVEIVNTLGQTLQTPDAGKVTNLNQPLDLSRFADGTYFLRVTVDGETAIRRVALQR